MGSCFRQIFKKFAKRAIGERVHVARRAVDARDVRQRLVWILVGVSNHPRHDCAHAPVDTGVAMHVHGVFCRVLQLLVEQVACLGKDFQKLVDGHPFGVVGPHVCTVGGLFVAFHVIGRLRGGHGDNRDVPFLLPGAVDAGQI